MRRWLLVALSFLFPFGLSAQSLNLIAAPVSPHSGATITLTWTDASPSVGLVAVQWTFSVAQGVTIGAPTLGPASGNKTITCNLTPPTGGTCVVDGGGNPSATPPIPLDLTPMPNGVVATFPVSAPAGKYTISLTNVIGANIEGTATAAISSTPATINITSKYDLNNDGVVNGLDVGIAQSQAVGATTCTNGDVNGDGVCNVWDVVLVILAALGRIPL